MEFYTDDYQQEMSAIVLFPWHRWGIVKKRLGKGGEEKEGEEEKREWELWECTSDCQCV